MAFIGFDLDETLGWFMSAHPYVFFLVPETVYKNLLKTNQPSMLSPKLRQKLDAGMKEFAKCLVTKDSELGLLRPGILPIIKRLAALKEEGRVKAISIYSNNGNLGLLLLAAAMIEYAAGTPGLFCNKVDWYNPLRTSEITPGRPGVAFKTADVLRKSFLDSQCGSMISEDEIDLKQTFFFDDLIHEDILTKIGPANYFHVNHYKNDPISPNELTLCLDFALRTVGLDTDEEYIKYISPIAAAIGGRSDIESYENIFTALTKYNSHSFESEQQKFIDDTESILDRLNTLFPSLSSPPPLSNYNGFPVINGGRTKRRRTAINKRKRTVKKATRKHRRPRKN